MRQQTIVLLSLFLLTTCSGCWLFCKAPEPISIPHVEGFHRQASSPIRRVAVLPMESDHQDKYPAEMLRKSVVNSLRQSGAFELIEVPQHELGPCRTNIVVDGSYDERQLVWLMKKYNVDAVLFSRLNHAKIHDPQSWNAICHIVEVREAMVIATAEGSWDLATANDAARFEKFVSIERRNYYEADIAHRSIQAVADFAGRELALELY